MSNELYHYGMPRRSGRYPWGSGEDPYQNAVSFRGAVDDLRKKGLSEKEIARGLGITDNRGEPSISRLRALVSISKEEVRAAQVAEAIRLQGKGMSNMAIGRQMGLNESSVRSLLDPVKAERMAITKATSNMLEDSIDKFGYIDVGTGVENHIGVSRTKLDTAIAELKERGYEMYYVKVEQAGMPGQFTSIKVLGAPTSGPEETKANYKQLFENKDLIQPIIGRSEDHGRSYSDLGLKPIQSVDLDRIKVQYGDIGKAKDGVIELRRGVEDLNLENSKYAQVRIGVDGTHYLKGMAIYSDNLPPGIDIVYNSSKPDTGNKLDSMKKMKDDPDNPFGATIKMDGQKGALNIIREEGEWDTWSRNISSQVLSKQDPSLAKKQLTLNYELKAEEFNDIMELTNPTVKRQLLMSFADDADASAVHLQAAAMPRQASKVILPVPSLRDTEVYAPGYDNGERVVLIRHPHGGTFEIPELIVNNKNKEARSVLGTNPRDAIGINPTVAQKLSGADFDGDTVIVIPNNKGAVKTQASLNGLKDFDPRESYPPYDGMKTIDGGHWSASEKKVIYPTDQFGNTKKNSQNMQMQMGVISNLITDMTIKGADTDKIARAVRHSMVIIDSEKHSLNYAQSRKDNGIDALAIEFQGKKQGGAATLISRASSEARVPERKNRVDIDRNTGEKLYTPTNATYEKIKKTIDPVTGKTVYTPTGITKERQTKITKMARESDAHALSSGTPMEKIYADYANQLKTIANTARKEAVNTPSTPYSPSAKVAYAKEVKSLNDKLVVAQRNRPLEREAQIIANSVVTKKMQSNPELKNDPDGLTKIKTQALAEARLRTGASKKESQVNITEQEWNAIQAGAVTTSKLKDILNNTSLDKVKEYATPRQKQVSLSAAKVNKAKDLLSSGYTQAEVAKQLGVSVSMLMKELYPS